MRKANKLDVVLERHGVKDPYVYLQSHGTSIRVVKAADPDVHLRGNVQLMKGRKLSRKEVKEGFSRLKFL